MDTIRITELPPKTYVEQGDYIAIDNQNNGTKKVQFTNLLDSSLSSQNKAADALTTGQAIGELNTSINNANASINNANTRIDNLINSGYTFKTIDTALTFSQNLSDQHWVASGSIPVTINGTRIYDFVLVDAREGYVQNDTFVGSDDGVQITMPIASSQTDMQYFIDAGTSHYIDHYLRVVIAVGAIIDANAEITDARIGASVLGGKTYSTLGDAIRTQVTDLKSDIDCIRNKKILLESGTYTEVDPVSKLNARARIRSAYAILTDSINSVTFPSGYTGYGQVFDASGHRLGFTSNYINSITRAMIRERYGDSAYSFVFVIRNDSTPSDDISSQIETVMNNTVVEWIEPIKSELSITSYYGASADLNNITKVGVWYGRTPNTLVNVPLSFAGSAFILEVLSENGVIIQKLTGLMNGQRAIRYFISDTWSEWASNPSYIVVSESSAESYYNNLAENLPSNGYYYISTTWFTDMASLGNKIGYLHTFAPKMFSTTLVLQVFYPASQGNVSFRTRLANGSWTSWRSVAQNEDDYHDGTAKYFAFGDSITYGQIGGSGGQRSQYNYPACVGRILKMTVDNRGVTNQGLIKDWDTIHTNFINNLDMTGAKLITVGWAYNDYAQYAGINFGSYDDTVDSTFIGKYYTIMKEFQQKCPDAKIILVTGYGYSDGTINPVVKPTLTQQFTHKYTFADGQKSIKQMYDTLEEMCYAHGWSCVNQAKGTVFNQWNANLLIGDQIHPTNDGYLRYGNYLGARIASLYANIGAW